MLNPVKGCYVTLFHTPTAQTTQPKSHFNVRENNGQRFYLYGPKLDQGISLQALGIWSTHWVRVTPDERSESHRDESVSHRLEESKVIVLAQQNVFLSGYFWNPL